MTSWNWFGKSSFSSVVEFNFLITLTVSFSLKLIAKNFTKTKLADFFLSFIIFPKFQERYFVNWESYLAKINLLYIQYSYCGLALTLN